MKRLYRSKTDSKLGGVMGGLGDYLNLDSTALRLLAIVAFVFTGFFPFGIIYLIAWAVMPEAPFEQSIQPDVGDVVEDVNVSKS